MTTVIMTDNVANNRMKQNLLCTNSRQSVILYLTITRFLFSNLLYLNFRIIKKNNIFYNARLN